MHVSKHQLTAGCSTVPEKWRVEEDYLLLFQNVALQMLYVVEDAFNTFVYSLRDKYNAVLWQTQDVNNNKDAPQGTFKEPELLGSLVVNSCCTTEFDQ